MLLSLVTYFGFTLRYIQDLPRSVRSITDLRNRRIYLERQQLGMHTPRTILLQTLGHIALGRATSKDFADFLRQQLGANYYAAATLLPERTVVPYLQEAKADPPELSIEDLCDVFSVSYDVAAHRFTNLATHHLDLPVPLRQEQQERYNPARRTPTTGLGLPLRRRRRHRRTADVPGVGRTPRFSADDRFSIYYQYTDTPTGTYFVAVHIDPGPPAPSRDHAGGAVRAFTLVPRPPDEPAGPVGPARTATAASFPPSPRPALAGLRLALGPRALPRPGRPPARRLTSSNIVGVLLLRPSPAALFDGLSTSIDVTMRLLAAGSTMCRTGSRISSRHSSNTVGASGSMTATATGSAARPLALTRAMSGKIGRSASTT